MVFTLCLNTDKLFFNMLDQRKRKLHFMYLLPLPVTSALLDFQWQVFVQDPIHRHRVAQHQVFTGISPLDVGNAQLGTLPGYKFAVTFLIFL